MYVVVAGRGSVCCVCAVTHKPYHTHAHSTHTHTPPDTTPIPPIYQPPFPPKKTHTLKQNTQDEIRRELLTAAAARDAPGEALYDVAKMYETGAYGAVPSPEKAVQFFEAVRFGGLVWGFHQNYNPGAAAQRPPRAVFPFLPLDQQHTHTL